MPDRNELEMSSVETQLLSLYTDRELLERELGTADPDRLVAMVRSLEGRLANEDAGLDGPAAALPGTAPRSTSAMHVMAHPEAPMDMAWRAVLERVGGESPADVLAHLDELEVRLVAAQARTERTVAAPMGAPAPLMDVVTSLRALATELCDRFERSELVFEGDAPGARWSVRCSSGSTSPI